MESRPGGDRPALRRAFARGISPEATLQAVREALLLAGLLHPCCSSDNHRPPVALSHEKTLKLCPSVHT